MDLITELQQQRESLKQNIQDMDTNIKKLTGRDPAESRRLSVTRRIQLKRNSLTPASDNQQSKRISTERRRWGNTAFNKSNNLDSGGEEQEEKKPAVQSSVVVTGKPIEPLREISEDNATKNRNKRMFGLLMGTLQQFKKDSQVKSEQEVKREEKLIKVEQQVQKDKDDAIVERRELFQTRRGKQEELRNIEFKIQMAELNEELKKHYEHIKDFIQLKSTPRIFYRPAQHNERTTQILKESQVAFAESLQQRMREINMCNESDIPTGPPRMFRRNRPPKRGPGRNPRDPIIIGDQAPNKRDLFIEDADNDKQEVDPVRSAPSSVVVPSNTVETPLEERAAIEIKDESTVNEIVTEEQPRVVVEGDNFMEPVDWGMMDGPSVIVNDGFSMDDGPNVTVNTEFSEEPTGGECITKDLPVQPVDDSPEDEMATTVIEGDEDERRVVSKTYDVVDERLVELITEISTGEGSEVKDECEVRDESEATFTAVEDMNIDEEDMNIDEEEIPQDISVT